MGWSHMGADWAWWMLFGSLSMVAFWGAVAWVVVVLVRRSAGEGESSREEHPLTVLERRYARGEIGTEEFEERRRRLRAM